MVRLDELEKMAVPLDRPGEEPGTVAILCGDAGRFTAFWGAMLGLAFQLPQGCAVKICQGSDIPALRNEAVAEYLEAGKVGGDWLWFIDDDHGFQPDICHRLAARAVDIVQPVCLRRSSPFLPVATGLDGDFLRLADHQPDELVEVMFAGSSGMMIRRRVLEAVKPPWFDLGNGVSEDVAFCRKAAEAGFKIHVDLAARLGHTTVATVWPTFPEQDDRWMTGFTIANGAELRIEAARPEDVRPLEE